MKKVNALRWLGLAGLSSLGSFVTDSSVAQDSGYFYGGLSIGQSRAKIDESRITASLLGAGLTTTSMARDESDTAYKVFGGYQFHRNFALEGGYFKLGEFGFTSTTTPAGTLDGRIKLQGLNIDIVGTMPLTDRLSAIARVGAQHARARDTFRGTGAVTVLDPNPSKTETNIKYGAGVQYAFSPSVLLRGEAEHYRVNDAVGNRGGVNVFSLSLLFPFGRAPATAPRAMTTPPREAPPSAQPPPPATQAVALAPVVPIVATPEPRRVSFSADSLFSFNESVIRPEGKAALDAFAKELKGTRFDVITVEGHTDRLGSNAYNQKLSAHRADEVKAYLVASNGVDATKISTLGKSESFPITAPGECKGSKSSKELTLCLQPDRRVEVEVIGMR